MKKLLMIALGLSLGATLSQAQEDPGKAAQARRAELIKKYDKNGDGVLDETEKTAMREELRKKREEERLKKYDKNGDGKLDDAEKEAMREDMKKRAEGARKRAEEKGKAAPHAPAAPATPPPPAPPEKK
jgi:Ca2+-binding EF-hand superfamily protein